MSEPRANILSRDYFNKKEGVIDIYYTNPRHILFSKFSVVNNYAILGDGFNFEESSKLYIQGDRTVSVLTIIELVVGEQSSSMITLQLVFVPVNLLTIYLLKRSALFNNFIMTMKDTLPLKQ